MQLKKSGSKQPRVCSVWVHRTVSGAPGWHSSTSCSQDFVGGVRLKFIGLSGEPTVSRANGRPQNPRATRGKCQRSDGAPDCPVRQRLQDCNGRLHHIRKEIRTGQCPVRQATEGKNCLLEMLSMAPSCLGAIKGTLGA
jgi:hypothetical protein